MTTKPDLTRVWASNAPVANVEDPDVTSSGKFSQGWVAEVPTYQNFNFIQRMITQGLAHINEQGIPIWDEKTTYPESAIVKGENGSLYISKSEQSNNNPINDDGTIWENLTINLKSLSTFDLISGGSSYPVGTLVRTIGFNSTEDNGIGVFLKTSDISSVSQTPHQTLNGTFTDDQGYVWVIASEGKVDIRSMGPTSNGNEISLGIMSAGASGHDVTLGGVDYIISDEVNITEGGFDIYYEGGSIEQLTWGLSAVQIRADNINIYNSKNICNQTKTQLSTTVPNRYEGNVSRARCSAFYLKQANNINIYNPYTEGFVNGVYLNGYEYNVWRTNVSGNTFTTTTFELEPEDQQVDDYYNGATIRVLSNTQATSNVRVIDYDSATNTVTFEYAQTTFSGPFNYYILLGRSNNIIVKDLRGDRTDFAVVGSGYKKVDVIGSRFKNIEQTQEVNARPHLTYLTSNCEDVAYIDNRVDFCQNGAMLKARGVKNITLQDNYCYRSRGIFEIESCDNVTTDNNISFEGGYERVGGDVYGGRFTNCTNVDENRTILFVDPSFDGESSAQNRPKASWYYSDQSSNAQQPTGVLNDRESFIRSNNSTIVVGNEIDDHYSVLLDCVDSGNRLQHADIINPTVKSDYALAEVKPVRILNSEEVTIINPIVQGIYNSADILIDNNSSNVTINQFEGNYIEVIDEGSSVINNLLVGQENISFSPTIKGQTTEGSNTYDIREGQSLKTGNSILLSVRIRLSGAIDSTGAIYIGDLPHPPKQLEGVNIAATAHILPFNNITVPSGSILVCTTDASTGRAYLRKASNSGLTSVTDSDFGNDAEFQMQMVYRG